jgi:hypothetical protein
MEPAKNTSVTKQRDILGCYEAPHSVTLDCTVTLRSPGEGVFELVIGRGGRCEVVVIPTQTQDVGGPSLFLLLCLEALAAVPC